MTYINVHVEQFTEWDDRKRAHMMNAELEFWRKRAEELQGKLDNIYSRAEDGDRTELWRGNEKIVVVREEP